ncbi:MAG: hypothetical protein EA411_08460 [Saprospirales bacterium]|nr:MAG: hypothetical protein EA411_08460 [Saprospirales bacterium]
MKESMLIKQNYTMGLTGKVMLVSSLLFFLMFLPGMFSFHTVILLSMLLIPVGLIWMVWMVLTDKRDVNADSGDNIPIPR